MNHYVGIFSEKQAEYTGTSIWIDAEGREHEITEASINSEQNLWSDKIVVSATLTRWVRGGRPRPIERI